MLDGGAFRVDLNPVTDAEGLLHLIHGAKGFGVIATKAVGALDDDMREPALPRIGQQLLIASAIRRFAGEDIDILGDDGQGRALEEVLLNKKSLPGTG